MAPSLRACLTAWLLAGLLLGARADMRVVTSVYEPYRIGPDSGLVVEAFLAACRAGGLAGVKVEMMPTERARKTFEADAHVVLIDSDTSLDTLPGRARYAMLKQWPYEVSLYYVKASFAPAGIGSVKDVAGKQMGYYRADEATRRYFDGLGAVMLPLDPHSRLFSMLLKGRIDVMVSVDLTAEWELDRQDPRWRERIAAFGPFYKGHAGPLYHLGEPEVGAFLARYQEGYRRIVADGSLQAIQARYRQARRQP
jgi:ABC-type amino acid transport substrate-binding protein